jgi:hypothetical protein
MTRSGRSPSASRCSPLTAVGGGYNAIALIGEDHLQQLRNGEFVLDDQHRCLAAHLG